MIRRPRASALLLTALVGVVACDGREAQESGSRPLDAAAPPVEPVLIDEPVPADAPRGRLVNVHVADGGGIAVDVWLQANRRYRAAKLAGDIGLGEASPWFAVPRGRTTAVVKAGDGPDGASLGSVDWPGFLSEPLPEGADTVTTLIAIEGGGTETLTRAVAYGDPAKGLLPEPARGQALVAFGLEALAARHPEIRNGETYMVRPYDVVFVGDRKKHCLTPIELPGRRPAGYLSIADGGGIVAIAPETRRLQLYPDPDCAKAPLATIDVELAAGDAVLVVVYSLDGRSLGTVVVPAAPQIRVPGAEQR